MHDILIFQNDEFGSIRTVDIDGATYFIGKDVAEALGYAEPRSAVSKKVEFEDRGVAKIETPSGVQEMTVVSESGLYALIFGSKLESAKRFKHWVTSEVLPAIRKNGSYHIQNLSKEMKAILMHDEKIVKIENRMDKLEFDIPLYGAEADELSRHVRRKGVSVLGGKKSEAYNDKGIRDKVYRDIYNEIKREFGVYAEDGGNVSYKALKRKYLPDAHDLIDCYKPPIVLAEQICDANAQMRF